MAITTVDGALAGMQPMQFFGKAVTAIQVAGRPQSLWSLAGIPGPGSFDTTLNGVTLSAPQNGQIPFTNPGAGNSYLTRFCGNSSVTGVLLLVDRLWHNGGFTITSASPQSITSPTWPARDNNGATAGEGVMLGLEISAAAGAAAPTITVGYTNSAGTQTRTGTNYYPTANSPTVGAFFPINLQAGDVGVQSVESLTLSTSWLSGTMNLVAYRVLATLELTSANTPNALDLLTTGFGRIYDDAVLGLIFIPSTTTGARILGSVTWTQG